MLELLKGKEKPPSLLGGFSAAPLFTCLPNFIISTSRLKFEIKKAQQKLCICV